MRRLLVEIPLDDFVRLKACNSFYRSVESFVVLQVLRAGPSEVMAIVQIRPNDPQVGFAELTRLVPSKLQLLDQNEGLFTCLMKFGPMSSFYRALGLKLDTGYIMPPLEVEGGRVRMTFVGSSSEVARFFTALGKLKVHHRVVSISDYRLSPHSPLNTLTDKQLRVVRVAYQQGYYDRPRRISSEGLARKLGLSSSTLVNHRLKAERRLLSVMLGQESLAGAGRKG